MEDPLAEIRKYHPVLGCMAIPEGAKSLILFLRAEWLMKK